MVIIPGKTGVKKARIIGEDGKVIDGTFPAYKEVIPAHVAEGLEGAGWIERVKPGGFFNVVVGHYDDLYPLIARTRAARAARDKEKAQ